MRSGSDGPWIGVYLASVGVFGVAFGGGLVVYSFLTSYFSWPWVVYGLVVILWTAPELLPKSSKKLAGAMRIGAFVSALVGLASGLVILTISS